MRSFNIKYPTVTKSRKYADKVFIVEAIRDLDEAIDLICDEMTAEEQLDPFAEDLCPYFGILWPSSEGLAEYIASNPDLVKNKKVLELGCGLGLPSLVAAHLGGDVLATDFHPDVEEYFLRNCRHSSINCKYERLNWRSGQSCLGEFDLVMGSDVLYESKHPAEIAKGLLNYVKPGGTILLSDPGRSYLQKFINCMNDEAISEEMFSVTVDSKEILILKFSK